MKWWGMIAFFCVVHSEVRSEEEVISSLPPPYFHIQQMVEPPMPLSLELPVALSQDNRQKYMENPLLREREAVSNRELVQSREFPWFSLLSGMVVSGLVLLIRNQPKVNSV